VLSKKCMLSSLPHLRRTCRLHRMCRLWCWYWRNRYQLGKGLAL